VAEKRAGPVVADGNGWRCREKKWLLVVEIFEEN
jgi:hypothetical protein